MNTHVQHLLQRLLRAGFACTLLQLGACSSLFDAPASKLWRDARITKIVEGPLPPGLADDTCLDAAQGDASITMVIAKYKSGRGSYSQAYALPPGLGVQVGDKVSVNPRLCKLEPLRSE